MKISSNVFSEGRMIPKKYTCDGENINPPLWLSEVPSEALALVLIMHDPDASREGGFTHWVVFNMDPQIGNIGEASSQKSGTEGINSSGKIGYTGPCPPNGTHHYEFKLYAIGEKISLDSSAKKEDVEKAIQGHIIEQSILTGIYSRG